MRFWFCWLLYTIGLAAGVVVTSYKLHWVACLVGVAFGVVFAVLENWERLWVSLFLNKARLMFKKEQSIWLEHE